jgi:elongation factor G
VGAIGVVQADRRRDVQVIGPGEIAVLVGELGLRTGDVLGAPGEAVHVPPPRFPEPVLTAAIEPARAEDGLSLLALLRALAADDPTLRVDHRGGRITVRGMGELHLEIVAERLRNRKAAAFVLGKPEVEHRSAIRGAGQAEVELRAMVDGVERRVRSAVAVRLVAGALPATVVGPHGAANEALANEVRYGLPDGGLVGAEVEVLSIEDGGTAAGEALVAAAAARALAEALQQAGVHGEEPEVELEIWCPEEGLQPVMADLGAREAEVSGVAGGRLGARVQGRAPLRRMLGYVTRLRSMTKGLGRASMQPAGWRPVVRAGDGG